MNLVTTKQMSLIENIGSVSTKMEKMHFPVRDKDFHEKMVANGPIIWMMQHNDPLCWMHIVPPSLEYLNYLSEKFEHDIYLVVLFHNMLDKFPLFGKLSRKMAPNIVKDWDSLVDLVRTKKPIQIGTCPESSNCFFEYDHTVAPFKTYGLIKLALEESVPIMVSSQYIDRRQSISLPISVGEIKGIRFPFYGPVKSVSCYEHFEISDEYRQAFKEADKESRRAIIKIIGDDIRQMMIKNYDFLEKEFKSQ